ncbi:hypothetical protein CR205_13130 [Alteribacter lacisalsi]|uniref:DUF3986 family protein n=1 Tax=Alteribacter lacisalsi TaxID=2045244 RepID=A0A2W0H990_9BACI|nr:DUF3986 family protein [Alteribacter lacisalsi]PYZ96640.1 hypothetical protein CR205_13130 [Alteribacter lacisalsi]
MDISYDDKHHLHLGYYEDNCDYEAIAFKRQLEDVWDIFFDFQGYGFKNITPKDELTLDLFGTRIFSIDNKEIDYNTGVQRLEQWLSLNNMI